MTNILVVGNSHLAALKLGWDLIMEQQLPFIDQFRMTFVGANNIDFVNWTCDPQGLISDHNLKVVANSQEFDSVLIVSMSSKLDLNQYVTGDTLSFLSFDVIKEIVNSYHFYHAPPANRAHIIFELVKAVPGKVLFLGAPCRPISRLLINPSRFEDQSRYIASYIRSLSAQSLLSDCSVSFLVPPEHLLCNLGISTPSLYLRDNNPNEIHANADYGMQILIYLFNTLQSS